MKKSLPKKSSLLVLLLMFAVIPLTVFLVQTRQQTKSKAAPSDSVGTPNIKGLVLPSILGFQSDLFTGASSVSYPISVPAGPGGLKPNLALSYSSSVLDDMHMGFTGNWRGIYQAQAGLAGLGWNLGGVDSITKSNDNDFYLSIGGVSYKLICDAYDVQGKPVSTSWSTSPKGFLRIEHYEGDYGHNPWTVTVKDGTKYIFGETDDSRAWDINGGNDVVYRWMVSKILDLHSNLVEYAYEKETQKLIIDSSDLYGDRSCTAYAYSNREFIREIRPTTISWANGRFQTHFSYEDREDNNIGAMISGEQYGNSCKQTHYSTERLGSIEILVDGNLLRKYALSYHYTQINSDYPVRPIVHSLLNKIEMFGTDGVTKLPAYTFIYEGDTATNNTKGNEAVLSQANNGYGGKVTFVYDRPTPGTIQQDEQTRIYNGTERARVIKKITDDGMDNTFINKSVYNDNGLGYTQWNPLTNKQEDYEFLGYWAPEDVLYEKNTNGENPTDVVVKSKKYYFREGHNLQDGHSKIFPDPRKGKTNKVEIRDKNDNLLSVSEENWSYSPQPVFNSVDGLINRDYSPLVLLNSQTNTIKGNPDKTTQTSYEYDQYANINKTIEAGDLAVNGDERFTTTSYAYNTALWIINKPNLVRLYRGTPNSNQEINRTGYIYDGQGWGQIPTKGDVTSVDKVGLNPEIHLTTNTTYDSFGNPVSVTDAKGKTSTTQYDATFHLYPVLVANPLGQNVSTEFNYRLGLPTKITDMNGVVTEFRYDVLGRATKIIKNGDTENQPTVEYTFRDQSPMAVGTKNRVVSGTDQITESYQFYNGLGQLIQSKTYGPAAGQVIVSNNVYNSRGANPESSLPYFQNSPINTYSTPLDTSKSYTEYDALGRAVKNTNLDSTFNTAAYNGFTITTTNEAGIRKITEKNVYGNVTKLQEYSSNNTTEPVYATTNYEYDIALGLVKKITDTKGNETTILYDNLGRKTEMRDPDLGRWQYKYDNNGNITEQTDAKNQTIKFEYDALNRLTKKVYPTGDPVIYYYDEGTYGKGKRTKMVDSSGETQTEYDNRGRAIKETKNIRINGIDNVFVTQYAYDNLDRITAVTYPDNEVVNYTYNRAGQPVGLAIAGGSNLVENTTYNASGQITAQVYGNNTSSDYSYNRTLRLDGIRTGGATPLFWKNYSYDPVGNITSIADNLDAHETENFAYDNLNRLMGANNAYTANYAYDELGNILTKTEGDNSRQLTYNNQQPVHAPKTVNGVNYEYDANGNLTKDELREITYDYDNRPISINVLVSSTPTPIPTESTPTPTAEPTPTEVPAATSTPIPTVTNEPTPTIFICLDGDLGNLDCDADGLIDEIDLSILLTDWTSDYHLTSTGHHSADLNGDTLVNSADLEILLKHWKTK